MTTSRNVASGLGSHVEELDGIRGMAILAVMLVHFFAARLEQPRNLIEQVVGRITGYGMWGVDLFFVLSGFLITGILWRSRSSSHYFRNFFVRRILRIFPLYYGVLFCMLALVPHEFLDRVTPGIARMRDAEGWMWCYLTNFYVARAGGYLIPYLSHFWSLAIEEHFYLFWPFIVGLLERKTILRVIGAIVSLALLSRIALLTMGYDELTTHVATPCRLDTLCIGAWFALQAHGAREPDAFGRQVARFWLPLSATLLFGLMLIHSTPSPWDPLAVPLKGTLLAGFFGCIIHLAAWSHGPSALKGVMRFGLLRKLGKYSYGLYVFHGIVAYGMRKSPMTRYVEELPIHPTLALILLALTGMAVSCLIAYASYELFEVHFLRLKGVFEADARAALRVPIEHQARRVA